MSCISQNDLSVNLVTHVDEVLEAAFEGGLPLLKSKIIPAKQSPSNALSSAQEMQTLSSECPLVPSKM